MTGNTLWIRHGKRFFDLLAASALVILLMPLGFLVGGMVRWLAGGPVFFTQMRPGLGGQPFQIYKFRTMTNQTDTDGRLLPDELRMTKWGSALRATSLDELPQLLNILRGDMSLVGPRPLLMQYLDRFTSEQARRMAVRPGITGWAQVNGRNAISWEERLQLDVWYVEHCCFWLDLKILGLTGLRLLDRKGIAADGHATMPEFTGSVSGERRVS